MSPNLKFQIRDFNLGGRSSLAAGVAPITAARRTKGARAGGNRTSTAETEATGRCSGDAVSTAASRGATGLWASDGSTDRRPTHRRYRRRRGSKRMPNFRIRASNFGKLQGQKARGIRQSRPPAIEGEQRRRWGVGRGRVEIAEEKPREEVSCVNEVKKEKSRALVDPGRVRVGYGLRAVSPGWRRSWAEPLIRWAVS